MNLRQKTTLLFSLLFLLYFVSRLVNLTLLPIFNDESTYIRYGMHQLHEPDHQPYSLLIGKEPLMPLLYALSGTISGDYLLGARMVTVFVGALTLLGLCLFLNALTNKRTAFVIGLCYLVAPYALFFDRLALMDSAVSTIAIWSLYLTYRLFRHPTWRDAVFLGVVTGIGLWTKASTWFYVLLPLVSFGGLYVFDNSELETKVRRLKMGSIALGIALLCFLPLFSNEKYAVHLTLLQQYTYPFFSVFSFPVTVWWSNLASLASWVFFYLTPPLCLLGLVSSILYWKNKKFWLVSLWLFIPFVYEILYAKLFTSRHALLLLPPLLLFAGYGWHRLSKKNNKIAYGLLAVILLWGSFYDMNLLTDPQHYPSLYSGEAKSDLMPYVFTFSSGYGVIDAIDYLKAQANTGPIVVVVRNDHGNPEDAVVGYLDYHPNISLVLLNGSGGDLKQLFTQIDPHVPIYFVSRGAYYAGIEHFFVSEKKFNKPNDTEFVGVERLKNIPH